MVIQKISSTNSVRQNRTIIIYEELTILAEIIYELIVWELCIDDTRQIFSRIEINTVSKNSAAYTFAKRFGWLVVLVLTALRDNISVYIGPSPREREKEKRSDR